MGLFNRFTKKEEPNFFTQRYGDEKLACSVQLEKENYNKLRKGGETYYWSDECKVLSKKVYELQKQYIQDHPETYEIVGIHMFKSYWWSMEDATPEDREVYRLLGEGRYYEDKDEIEQAITIYEKAKKLFFELHGEELKEIEKETGKKLSDQVPEQRLKVCENKLFRKKTKQMGEEAKSLEQDYPQKAIEIYEELNRLRPGLKKYNNRIRVCENKLKKQKEL